MEPLGQTGIGIGLAAAALASAALASSALAAETIEEALRQSELIFDWRMRYESVDHAAFSKRANAATSRLLAGFKTAPLRGTSLLAEGVWIEDIVDDYDSTTNGNVQYPVVPDPAGYGAVNRFALVNDSLPDTRFTLGRQRIVLDDARFVGNVGWRQKEQTFDGLRAETKAGAWSLDFTYAIQVNRIFGPRSPVGKWEGDIWLANASRDLGIGKLTLFGYRAELDDAPAVSSDTFGVKLAGARPVGAGQYTVTYAGAYARQFDAGENPADFAETYYLVEGGLRRGAFGGALGYEVLGGNGQTAFSTPLATLHAFQGWADLFLATPAAGIEDRYVRFNYQIGQRGPFTRMDLVAFYHAFRANEGSARYGQEVDLQLVARLAKLALGLKYATYSARDLAVDVDKLWFSLEFSF